MGLPLLRPVLQLLLTPLLGIEAQLHVLHLKQLQAEGPCWRQSAYLHGNAEAFCFRAEAPYDLSDLCAQSRTILEHPCSIIQPAAASGRPC